MVTDIDDMKRELTHRMDGAIEALKRDFAGLRTGRAHPALLESIRVIAYGIDVPLIQLTTISAPEPRMLIVQVWDKAMVIPIEKAIYGSGLGLNPILDGTTVRVPIPQLSADRREELAKVAHKWAENCKVAVRSVRRDGMEQVRKLERQHLIGSDIARSWSEEIQKLTDVFVKRIDDMLSDKNKDIRQVDHDSQERRS
jgi:ribosome recycling factor